jgi:hypothetical protein
MDARLKDFNWNEFLTILFPFSIFFNKKKQKINIGTVYDIKRGHPVTIRSEKIMSQYEQMYFKTNGTGGLAGSNITDSQFSLDMVKIGLKREICDHIMNSDLFEWVIEDTPMGTKVAARIVVNKFENN